MNLTGSLFMIKHARSWKKVTAVLNKMETQKKNTEASPMIIVWPQSIFFWELRINTFRALSF